MILEDRAQRSLDGVNDVAGLRKPHKRTIVRAVYPTKRYASIFDGTVKLR